MEELYVFDNLIDFSHSDLDEIRVGSHMWSCLMTSSGGLNNNINKYNIVDTCFCPDIILYFIKSRAFLISLSFFYYYFQF